MMTWLITISCYGSHLPGDSRGSFDHVRNGDHRFMPPAPALERYARELTAAPSFALSSGAHRQAVLDAIIEVCRFRDWPLLALHIPTTHIHGVVEAPDASGVLRDWKSYASRSLRPLTSDCKYWTRGGSLQALPTRVAIEHAVHYILEKQGTPMERFVLTRALTHTASRAPKGAG